jgi:DNA-binding MarR family transcriptional regulator
MSQAALKKDRNESQHRQHAGREGELGEIRAEIGRVAEIGKLEHRPGLTPLDNAALALSGLKTTQRAILAQIARFETTTVGSLAEALVMDAGALAHTLKPLERDRLVSIDVDPDDRRNRLIALTSRGRTRLSESDLHWENAQRAFETALGRLESDALREAMRSLVSGEFAAAFKAGISAANARRS